MTHTGFPPPVLPASIRSTNEAGRIDFQAPALARGPPKTPPRPLRKSPPSGEYPQITQMDADYSKRSVAVFLICENLRNLRIPLKNPLHAALSEPELA
jgi:hypothetical protein